MSGRPDDSATDATEPVVMYSTTWCGYCERARALFRRKGVRFREIKVDEDPTAREAMLAQTGRRTVPQIFVGERHVGGFDDLYMLEQAGELDGLLSRARDPGAAGPPQTS